LINVDNGNPNYSSHEGVLYNKLKTQLIKYPAVKTGSFSIPASVTSVENFAFYGCSGLTSITISEAVTSIGFGAFFYCKGLTSITIPSLVTFIGRDAFNNCTGLISIYANPITPVDLSNQRTVFGNINKSTCTLYVPIGSKSAYQASNQWKDFINIVENNTTAISTVNNQNIRIYPNPVFDNFSIYGFEGVINLKIIDLNGKMLIDKKVSMNENLSISNLPKGMYIVNVKNREGEFSTKIVKE